jgi:mannose-6-phosphate isomerase-like protein (cupin superfamily)
MVLAAPIAPAADQPSLPPLPVLADLTVLAQEPLAAHETIRITRLTETAELSALLVQVRGTLPLHFHRRLREVLYLIQGEGLFRVGNAAFPMHAGSVIRVEPGEVHTFSAKGGEPAVFFAVTAPRWDESDRVLVPEEGPSSR